MRPKFQLRMQTLMVLVLVPALLVVIGAFGWSNYQAVYQVILEGFNRKLEAISTSSAAFVDGDEHERLIALRDVQGIAYDSIRKRMLGADRGYGFLLSLDSATGSAEEVVQLDADEPGMTQIRALAFDAGRDRLVGLLDDRLSVVAVVPATGKVSKLFTLAEPAGALALDPKSDEIYFGGEKLWRSAASKLAPRAVGKIGLSGLQGLVWDPASADLVALESASGFVFRISPKDARIRFVGPLVQDGNDQAVNAAEKAESKQWVEPQLVKLPGRGIALDSDNSALFAATDRLLRLSPENGKADPAGFRAGYRSDSSALYMKYATPMARVMAERELTYHYSTILPSENQLIYVLDATGGEDHSAAGTEEEVEPAEWQRLDKVFLSGQPSQSDIKQFDIWGLLKVGSAVIRNRKGEAVGLMGADVDISTINAKTRIALLEVLFVGFVSLVLAAFASVVVTRRLIQPLNRLKAAALQVAAGKYDRSLRVFRPKEVEQLAQAFDRVRSALRERMESLDEKTKWFESHRRTHELMKLFARGFETNETTGIEGVTAKFLGETIQSRRASGWVTSGESMLVWIGRDQLEPLEAARLRSDIGTGLRRIVARRGPHWDRLKPELEPLFRTQVSMFMLLDGTEKAVYSLAREGATGTIISAGDRRETCLLVENTRLVLPPGSQFVFSSRESANGRNGTNDGTHDEAELFATITAGAKA